MMKYVADIAQRIGTRKDHQTGDEKGKYSKLGVILKDEQTGRSVIKLEALPLSTIDKDGNPVVWLNIFPKREDAERRTEQQRPKSNQGYQQQGQQQRYGKEDRPMAQGEEMPPPPPAYDMDETEDDIPF